MTEKLLFIEKDMEKYKPMRIFDAADMYTYIETFAKTYGLSQTQKALPFAWEKHRFQVRKGKETVPYIVHPLTMACHAISLGIEEDNVLATCLLHDVCEDCGVSPKTLPVTLEVQNAVDRLTLKKSQQMTKAEAKHIYYKNMRKNQTACLVKLFDRCNNVSEMAHGFTEEKLKSYIAETRNEVLPLIGELQKVQPQYDRQLFALKYQICSVVDAIEAMLLH